MGITFAFIVLNTHLFKQFIETSCRSPQIESKQKGDFIEEVKNDFDEKTTLFPDGAKYFGS